MTNLYIEWLLALLVYLVPTWFIYGIIRNIINDFKEKKESDNLNNENKNQVMSEVLKQRWLYAKKRLEEFLEDRPYIGHPEAQKFLAEEIEAYRKYIKESSCEEDRAYLNYLLSLRNRRKQSKPFYIRRIK